MGLKVMIKTQLFLHYIFIIFLFVRLVSGVCHQKITSSELYISQIKNVLSCTI